MMSVFTPISRAQMHGFVTEYRIGQLTQFVGIDGGTDNSNYFVDTDTGRFVLTLFERLTAAQLPFFLSLGDQLKAHHCLVAEPIHDANGLALKSLSGKPAVLFQRVPGHHISVPSTDHCQQMAAALGDVHVAPLQFDAPPCNAFGLDWLHQHRTFSDWQDAGDQDLYAALLTRFDALPSLKLPKGIIHADMFHDNALFEHDQLRGLIDWYFACHYWLLLDVAIMVNDWCVADNGFDADKVAVMVAAYQEKRRFTEDEEQAFTTMRVLAATRFWLSRTLAWSALKDEDQSGITVKPPAEMKQLIQRLLSE
jgi:homoserine kinase type II